MEGYLDIQMLRDYQIVSPSLEGVLNDSLLSYEGLKRPNEILKILDGPAAKGRKHDTDSEMIGNNSGRSEEDKKVLEQYFQDLYGIFMKRLSVFVVGSDASSEDEVTMQAMLQEMIKIKGLMR